jgi:hypothetical protein
LSGAAPVVVDACCFTKVVSAACSAGVKKVAAIRLAIIIGFIGIPRKQSNKMFAYVQNRYDQCWLSQC